MPLATLPATVLQEIGWSVYTDVSNRKDIDAIDRKAMPGLDFAMKIKKEGGSAGGETRVLLKKSGGTEIQFWERRDPLAFGETNIDLEMRFPFVNMHAGLEIVHEDLLNEGYSIQYNQERSKNFAKKNSVDELNRLADILQEKIETFMDDWKVDLDLKLMRDGSYDSKAIVGLDGLIPTSATAGSIGGKSRTNPLLQHTVFTGLTTGAGGTLYTQMTRAWRQANLNGRGRSSRVDFLMAGSDFIMGYLAWRLANNFSVNANASRVGAVDIALDEDDAKFKGLQIVYNPTMDYLDTVEPGLAVPWSKRCYGLASKALKIVSPSGMWEQFSAPRDPADQRFTRFSLDTRMGYLNTCPNSHFLVAIA